MLLVDFVELADVVLPPYVNVDAVLVDVWLEVVTSEEDTDEEVTDAEALDEVCETLLETDEVEVSDALDEV